MRYSLEIDRCLIPEILAEIGWTQQDLSNYTGIDKTTISRYVRNKRPVTYLASILITDTIYAKTGVRYSPRDLYSFKKQRR